MFICVSCKLVLLGGGGGETAPPSQGAPLVSPPLSYFCRPCSPLPPCCNSCGFALSSLQSQREEMQGELHQCQADNAQLRLRLAAAERLLGVLASERATLEFECLTAIRAAEGRCPARWLRVYPPLAPSLTVGVRRDPPPPAR